MGRTQGIRRASALILIVGLLAGPALMADPGRTHDGPHGVFASIEQLVKSVMAEAGGWLDVTFGEQTTDGGTTDSFGPGPTQSGDDSTTDSGPTMDPDG